MPPLHLFFYVVFGLGLSGYMSAQMPFPNVPYSPSVTQPLNIYGLPQQPALWQNPTVAPAYPRVMTAEELYQRVQQNSRTPLLIGPGQRTQTAQQRAQQTLEDIKREERETEAVTDTKNLANYQAALQKVEAMLQGRVKPSIIDANYSIEQAYGHPYLKYADYKTIYKQSAAFIRRYLKQQHITLNAPNLHLAIQRFMGDTLFLRWIEPDTRKEKTIIHYPFRYDYQDYACEKDYRNSFSTKCLATGTGQCNSLPIVYLCLAEELGIPAYLSFAPYHSFIKWKDAKGDLLNYEPTSNWRLPNKWYEVQMGINYNALRNGLYLDTLNQQQILANCLVDLAMSYLDRNPGPDAPFVERCLTTASRYFPKHNNVYIRLVRSKLLATLIRRDLWQQGIHSINDPALDAATKALYQQFLDNESTLRQMGYEELSPAIYDEMVQQQNNRTNDPNAKLPKSLFQTD